MITKDQAVNSYFGQEVHYGKCTLKIGPRGGKKYSIERWRINGQCKTWKTRPDHFKIPIKHGLYNHAYLTNWNADRFHLESDCTLE